MKLKDLSNIIALGENVIICSSTKNIVLEKDRPRINADYTDISSYNSWLKDYGEFNVDQIKPNALACEMGYLEIYLSEEE